MKPHSRQRVLFFCATFLLLFILGMNGSSYKQLKTLKDTSAIVLKEIVVQSILTKDISSEPPKKISSIGGGPLTHWMAVFMNEPKLFQKQIKTFSIFTTKKKTANNLFELVFYTLGANDLPGKKLNSIPFEFSLNKRGWNEFEIPNYILVPENGIILAIRFKKREADWPQQENSIGLGVYTSHKPTYIVDGGKWRNFPIYQPYQEKYSNRVSLMLKITTNPS